MLDELINSETHAENDWMKKKWKNIFWFTKYASVQFIYSFLFLFIIKNI